MSKLNLAGYAVGDIVQTHRTHKVVRTGVGGIELHDVKAAQQFYVSADADHGTLHIEMVKKAIKPKPKMGDIITGRQLNDIWWKRGAVVRWSGESGVSYVYILQANGTWDSSSGGTSIPFRCFDAEAKFTVLWVT